MNRGTLAIALSLATAGCDTGSAASPVYESSPATGEGGGADAAYVVCPPGMDASFGSIYTQMLSTSSCGTNNPNNCHSPSGSSFSNLLDMSLDAGAVATYAELLGADGGGHVSTNVAGDASVLRVVPFEAGASMLYIKLTLTSSTDPSYGSGMPLGNPGSVCPDAVSAVRDWINAGAPFAPPDSGTVPDGGSDAGSDAPPD